MQPINDWPAFKLSKPTIPRQFPKHLRHQAQMVRTLGVPESFFGRFRAMRRFECHRFASAPHIAFATAFSGMMTIDRAGQVGRVLVVNSKPHFTFANSNYAVFHRIVEKVIGAFPYYDQATDDPNPAADRLAQLINSIDSSAIKSRYWTDFIDDVRMGDFATELFAPPGRRPSRERFRNDRG